MEKNKAVIYSNYLSEPYQKAFLLYYFHDLSQKEVAETMKISVFKARNYLTKALYLIRQISNDDELNEAKRILYQGNI